MVSTHPDYYFLLFKVHLMCINGIKLIKQWIEFLWAQVKTRKKGEDCLVLPSTPFFIYTTKYVSSAPEKEMLTVSKLSLNWFLWF
jgi:hypothetical protein